MSRKFKIMSSRDEVDLVPYIREYLNKHENVDILIGCDSQNHGKETHYALVIGLYRPGKGGHVLFQKTIEPRDKIFQSTSGKSYHIESTRLINEVWMSVDLAEFLRAEGLPMAKYIDIDLNPDPQFKSNAVLSSAMGLVVGMGYNVRYKHSAVGEAHMCYASDHLVK